MNNEREKRKKEAPQKTVIARMWDKLPRLAGALRRHAWAVLALCAVLLLVNVGIPALNEKEVYNGTDAMSSAIVEGHEPRTVTDGAAGWLAYIDWRELPAGDYTVLVYYSTDTDNNHVQVYTNHAGHADNEQVTDEQLDADDTVQRFRISIDEDGHANFLLFVVYNGVGTLTVDKVVIWSARSDLAAVRLVLNVAVLLAAVGCCVFRHRKAEEESEPLPWKKRVKKALPVALLLSVTFCVAGPIGLYATNTSEFWFSLGQMMPMVLVCFTAAVIVVTALLSVVPKKLFYLVLAAVFGLGAALYVEGNFLVRDLGVLDGSSVDWDEYGTWAVIDTLIVLAITLLPVALMYFRGGVIREKLITFSSLFLVFTQLLATGMSVISADDLDGKDNGAFYTTENFTSLSKEENILILLSDQMDAGYLRSLLADEPEYADRLEDFICYDNASALGFSTLASLPSLFSGVVWDDTVSLYDTTKLAGKYAPLFKVLTEKDYDIGVYTNPDFIYPSPEISNTYQGRPYIDSQTKFTSAWMGLTAYRYFPHILKGLLDVTDFTVFESVRGGPDGMELYVLDSQAETNYYHRELSADNEKKTFLFFHFMGTHENLNEFGYSDNITTDSRQRTKGSLAILFNYIDQMKELGVYDDSTIILMADHGMLGENVNSLLNPVFLIKPKGYSGKFSVSEAPISYEDLVPTILNLIGEDSSRYGRTIFEIGEDEQRQRESWGYWYENSEYEPRALKYTGTAHAADWKEWTLEGTSPWGMDAPVHEDVKAVAEHTETIDNVEEYNNILAKTVNEVRCDFASAPTGDVQVNMTLYSLTDEPAHLVVTANGTEVFNDASVSGDRSFAIPDELVDDSVTLRFTFPEATDKSGYLIVYDFAGTDMGE